VSVKGILTPRAKRFVEINATNSVVSAAWLDKDREHPSGPPETWVKMRYQFDNMQQITLHEADLAALDAAGIKPIWWSDRHRLRGRRP
jgi:hypothetical protein